MPKSLSPQFPIMSTSLVTGGARYIGSHAVLSTNKKLTSLSKDYSLQLYFKSCKLYAVRSVYINFLVPKSLGSLL